MQNSDFSTKRPLTVNAFIEIALKNLSDCYCHYNADETTDDFLEIVEWISFTDDPSIEGRVSVVSQFVSENDKERGADAIATSPISSIILACVACSRAGQALFRGESELAWTYIADAQFWVGVSKASVGIQVAREKTIIDTRAIASFVTLKKNAKAGADARDRKYEPIRNFAFGQVRDKMPLSGWQSRSHAVTVIHPSVGAFTLRQGSGLKAPAMKTIDTWLAAMDEAPSLFTRK